MPETWSLVLILVVAGAVLLFGFSKTGMPVAGVMAGPIIAAALGPAIGSGFVVPLLLLGDLMGLALYRSHADWTLIRRLVPGVLAGFVITAVLFEFVDMVIVGRILGLLILASVFLEVKQGPYDPATAVEFAPWAPPEGDPAVAQYQQWLRAARVGERY